MIYDKLLFPLTSEEELGEVEEEKPADEEVAAKEEEEEEEEVL